MYIYIHASVYVYSQFYLFGLFGESFTLTHIMNIYKIFNF